MADTDGARQGLIRLPAAAGAVTGAVLLLRPAGTVARLCPGFPLSRLWIVRALGLRLLAQHGLLLARPQRRLARAGAAVDLLHAASMLPLVGSARYGRAARISGGLAAGWAALQMATARPPA